MLLKSVSFVLLLISPTDFPVASRPAPGAIPRAAVNGCDGCGRSAPEEGPLSGRLRLGKPVEFDDGVGINGGRCLPLYEGERLLAWLNDYREVGSRIYLRRCAEDASITGVAPGSKGGFVEDVYEEMTRRGDGGEAAFIKLDLPLWSEFADPAFCGWYVAYWGTEAGAAELRRVYAVVLDLRTREVVKKEFLGSLRIESDSRGFFPAPQWHENGRRVLFDSAGEEGIAAGASTGLNSVTLSIS